MSQDWKEARRKRALELKDYGWKPIRIAEALGVSRAAVSQWIAEASQRGPPSWRAKPRPGGPLKLTGEQLDSIPEWLSQGAEAHGFLGDVWTCARVATVIGHEFGVSYHKAHVSRWLKELGWTPQMPVDRAAHRDETLIQQGRTDGWPELKKGAEGRLDPCVH